MITIFTDGAARGNPGPGGWGAIVAGDDSVVELGGRESHTTNNRMELAAAISALRHSNIHEPATVYTDSAYVVSGITRWVIGWQKNKWKTAGKDDVLNRDLWEALVEATHHRVIDWKLLKGHAGIPANERCDDIATTFADGHTPVLFNGARLRYGVSLEVSSPSAKVRKSPSSGLKSKQPAYSYISLVDGVIKVHATWEECKARVNGVSGARFKKAVSQEDEEEIIKAFST